MVGVSALTGMEVVSGEIGFVELVRIGFKVNDNDISCESSTRKRVDVAVVFPMMGPR